MNRKKNVTLILISLFFVCSGVKAQETKKIDSKKQVIKREYIQVIKGKRAGEREYVIYPVDDGKNDPSFVKFRSRLIKAVKEKNLEILLNSISSHIEVGSADTIQEGKNGVIRNWELNIKPKESRIWFMLSEVLRLGGFFIEEPEYRYLDRDDGPIRKVFKAPYPIRALWLDNSKHQKQFYSKVGEDEIGVITGKNVNLRNKPSVKGKVIGKLSYNIVLVHYDHLNRKTRKMMNYKYNWHSITMLSGLKGYVYGKYLRRRHDFLVNFAKEDGKWRIIWYSIPD